MERADEVLSRRCVDAGFAADRRVDHREETRRHLYIRHASHERRRHKTGEIADNAAAERDHGRVPTKLGCQHLIGEARPRLARLLRLARDNRERRRPGGAERGRHAGGVPGANVGIGDDRVAMGWCRLLHNVADAIQDAGADGDAVRPERDVARRAHQVTSPAPPRLFATRASVNSKSDNRFK